MLLFLLFYNLSPYINVFTNVYEKQTVSVGCKILLLFCGYNIWYYYYYYYYYYYCCCCCCCTTLQVGRARDRFQAVTLVIYSVAADISVRPGVDSASKNEYQDIAGGKGGRCVMVTILPPSCDECLVIWSLNRPVPCGVYRAVIVVAVPYYCY